MLKEAIEDLENTLAYKNQSLEELILEQNEILGHHGEGGDDIREKEQRREEIEAYLKEVSAEKAEISKGLEESKGERTALEWQLEQLQNQKYEMEIKKAKQDTQLDNLKNKLWEEFEISYLDALTLKSDEFVMTNAIKENREIKNRIAEIGDVNIGAIKEYESVSERYNFLTSERNDIENSMNELRQIIEEMDVIIRKRFKESFDSVASNFDVIFKELHGGGSASITIDDEQNPLEANLELAAQPPGKQLKNINLLSGGEKSMTAIALMFAVLKTKPTPCCILDEVDAALDDNNIRSFAGYLQNFNNIQFTLITHQKSTMEFANSMYGITMPEQGVSKIYSLKLDDSDNVDKNIDKI
ncbi:MAG: hypothetical protein ACRCUS_00125, partial [Anaerovoracaceae bacterium]